MDKEINEKNADGITLIRKALELPPCASASPLDDFSTGGIRNKKKATLIYAPLGVFLAGLLVLVFICSPLQYRFGMYGVAMTEIIIIVFALMAAKFLKYDFKEAFPLKLPTFRKIFGTMFLWYGAFMILMVVALIMAYLFPDSYLETGDSVTDLMQGLPEAVVFIIMTLFPAVCEETLFRGTILFGLKKFDKKWLVIIICGVMFGVYHLNFIKFFTTGILGISLAYLMLKTDNLIYPIIFHFVNNAASTWPVLFLGEYAVTMAAVGTDSVLDVISLPIIGIYFIIASFAPFWVLIGVRLLEPKPIKNNFAAVKAEGKGQWKRRLAAIIICVVMILSGVVILINNPLEMTDLGINEELFEEYYDLFDNDTTDRHFDPIKGIAGFDFCVTV